MDVEGEAEVVKSTRECTRCGKCCTNPSYMGTLGATGEDVKRWQREGRDDILTWVSIFGPKDDPYGDLWVSERTGEEATRCPFVRKDRNRPTYRCTIYDTRPEVCRNYVPWSSHAICEEVVVDIPSPKGTPQKRPR
jgi:Fe-S-cluster containining protein